MVSVTGRSHPDIGTKAKCLIEFSRRAPPHMPQVCSGILHVSAKSFKMWYIIYCCRVPERRVCTIKREFTQSGYGKLTDSKEMHCWGLMYYNYMDCSCNHCKEWANLFVGLQEVQKVAGQAFRTYQQLAWLGWSSRAGVQNLRFQIFFFFFENSGPGINAGSMFCYSFCNEGTCTVVCT